ncbi:MAG TPA: nuclease-related domain-containing protein [Anaerolineales bacterium]
MKIYIDRQKVNARAQAAHIASVGGLLLLLVSVVLPLFLPKWSTWMSALMVLGAAGAMVGIYLANRWVRRPRPEESLDKALRALDDQYHLYHYPASLPCEHILLTPTGVLALEVVNLSGSFSYRHGRWREAMTVGRALRYLVEERVSDPVVLAQAMVQEMSHRLDKDLEGQVIAPIRAVTVFTHPAVDLEVEGGSVPACKIDKIRKQASISGPRLAPDVYEKVSSYFERLTVP